MVLTSEEPISFTVRPLPRGVSLEGAFRVHLASKDLDLLGIKPGELVQLTTAEGTSGTGIAWRSTEITTKAGTHPVKLTDIFRDAFNFKLGTHLTIIKSPNEIYRANRVIVTDVSDHELQNGSGGDVDIWKWQVGSILAGAEAIANNIAFEATSRKGQRKRYLIESISAGYRASNALFFFDGRTELILQDESAGPTPSPRMSSFKIHANGVGGLTNQLAWLHGRLDLLVGEVQGRKLPRNCRRNGGILLHGPSGTGKSLVLKRIATGPWRKVIRIDHFTLPGPVSRNQTIINSSISEATSMQPCLILIDDIHLLAGSSDGDTHATSMAHILGRELDRLQGTQVLVVATAPRPNSVNKVLREPGRFLYDLEIPVPDRNARMQILHALNDAEDGNEAEFESVADTMAEKTHAYTGRDLDALYRIARDNAIARFIEDDWSASNASGLESPNTLVGHRLSTRPSVSTIMSAETISLGSAHVQPNLADFEKALLTVRPSAMQEVMLETPKVQWSEIGGSGEVKDLLVRAIEWPLKYGDLMAEFSVPATKGILLYGPPGCSKTLTAKAVATSSGLNFLAVKGAELTSMYVGESERAIREVFQKARAAAPSVVFFDEIESIAAKRDKAGDNGLHTLTTLLNEMDGIESLNGVLVLAATNRPETIDSALLRPGRFDNKIYIGPPNESARQEIFSIRTCKVKHVASNVDIAHLASMTEGFSGAEIVNICTEASIHALERSIAGGDSQLTAADFERALEKAVRSITPELVAEYEQWSSGL